MFKMCELELELWLYRCCSWLRLEPPRQSLSVDMDWQSGNRRIEDVRSETRASEYAMNGGIEVIVSRGERCERQKNKVMRRKGEGAEWWW